MGAVKRLVAVAAFALLAGCASNSGWTYTAPDGRVVTEGDYRAAMRTGGLADVSDAALETLGRQACDSMREHGLDAFAWWVDNVSEVAEVPRDDAITVVSAFVVRYCPDLTD